MIPPWSRKRGPNRLKLGADIFVFGVTLLATACAVLGLLAPLAFGRLPAIAHRAVRFRILAIFALFVSCSLYVAREGAARFLDGLPQTAKQAASELRATFVRWLKSEEPVHLLAFAVVLAVALWVRVTYLFEPIRYDEAFTYLVYARRPLWDAISNYSYPNNHLLLTALVHICSRLFGSSEWALRLPALLAGVAVVAATYLLARRLTLDKNVALMSAAISAVSVPLIEYSVEARGYTLVVLFSLVIFRLCAKVQQDGSSGRWAAIVTVSALGFATIPIMLFPYIAAMIWTTWSAALSKRRSVVAVIKEIAISTVCTALLTFLAYTPAMLRTGPRSILANRFVRPLDWGGFLKYATGFPHLLWRDWTVAIPGWLLAILICGLALSLVGYKQVFRSAPLLPIAIAAAAGLCVMQRVVPPPRVFLYIIPLLSIYSGAGVCIGLRFLTQHVPVIRNTAVAVASLVFSVLLALSVVHSREIPRLDDFGGLRHANEIAGFLHSLGPGQKVIAMAPCDAPLGYVLERHGQIASGADGTTRGPYFIVVNELSATAADELQSDSSYLTIGGIRRMCGLDGAESAYRLVKRFGSNVIYASEGRGSSCGAIVIH